MQTCMVHAAWPLLGDSVLGRVLEGQRVVGGCTVQADGQARGPTASLSCKDLQEMSRCMWPWPWMSVLERLGLHASCEAGQMPLRCHSLLLRTQPVSAAQLRSCGCCAARSRKACSFVVRVVSLQVARPTFSTAGVQAGHQAARIKRNCRCVLWTLARADKDRKVRPCHGRRPGQCCHHQQVPQCPTSTSKRSSRGQKAEVRQFRHSSEVIRRAQAVPLVPQAQKLPRPGMRDSGRFGTTRTRREAEPREPPPASAAAAAAAEAAAAAAWLGTRRDPEEVASRSRKFPVSERGTRPGLTRTSPSSRIRSKSLQRRSARTFKTRFRIRFKTRPAPSKKFVHGSLPLPARCQ